METDTLRLIGLLAVVGIAVWVDIRTRKVPNKLIVIGSFIGVLGALLPNGIGFAQSIYGFGIGLAMMLPMYALRATGAGDVKLMACVGSFLGAEATFIATLCVFAFGGMLALLFSARVGALMQTMRNIKMFIFHVIVRFSGGGLPNAAVMPVNQARMPYTLAIAGGVIIYLVARFDSTSTFI